MKPDIILEEENPKKKDDSEKLYDRQLRLWGRECQGNLQTCRILVSGIDGLAAEIVKNLILSGVYNIKLNDDKLVTEEDFTSQFLVPRDAIGSNRAISSIKRLQAMNRSAKLSVDTEPLFKKDEKFFSEFNLVIIVGANNNELLRINKICRENNIQFFSCDLWGVFGYGFADLQKHSFLEDVVTHKKVPIIGKPAEVTLVTSVERKELTFPSYEALLQFDINSASFLKKQKRTGPAFTLLRILQTFRDIHNRDPANELRAEDIKELERIRDNLTNQETMPNEYFQYIFEKISPAAAVVGGIMSQEIIKTITRKEAPFNNVFLFDPKTYSGFIEKVGNEDL